MFCVAFFLALIAGYTHDYCSMPAWFSIDFSICPPGSLGFTPTGCCWNVPETLVSKHHMYLCFNGPNHHFAFAFLWWAICMLICSQLPPFLDRLPYNFRSKNIQNLHKKDGEAFVSLRWYLQRQRTRKITGKSPNEMDISMGISSSKIFGIFW